MLTSRLEWLGQGLRRSINDADQPQSRGTPAPQINQTLMFPVHFGS